MPTLSVTPPEPGTGAASETERSPMTMKKMVDGLIVKMRFKLAEGCLLVANCVNRQSRSFKGYLHTGCDLRGRAPELLLNSLAPHWAFKLFGKLTDAETAPAVLVVTWGDEHICRTAIAW